MHQRKLGSLIEAIANIVIGFAINFIANMTILPMFGFNITAGQAFSVGLIFTIISVVRSYYVRRLFNQIKAKWNVNHPKDKPFEVHP